MTEENLEKRIFFDTNVILPPSTWEFSRCNLDQRNRERSNTGDLEDIDCKTLARANNDLRQMNNFFNANYSDVRIPGRVQRQTLGQIDETVKKIENREVDNNYLFSKFSEDVNGEGRGDETVVDGVMNYKEALQFLRWMVDDRRYSEPRDDTYSALFDLVSVIHNHFNIGKDNREVDLADWELGVSILYESINGNQVDLYCDDKDVTDIVAGAYSLLSEESPMDGEGYLDFFFQNPPNIYNVWNGKDNGKNGKNGKKNRSNGKNGKGSKSNGYKSINIKKRGKEIITPLEVTEGEKRKDYRIRVGRLANGLERVMKDLRSSFQDYQDNRLY